MLFDSVLRTQMQFGIVVFFFILCSADRRLAHLPPQGFNTLVVCAIVVTMSSRRAFVVSSHVSGGTRYSSRYQRHQSIKSLKVFAFFLGDLKMRDNEELGRLVLCQRKGRRRRRWSHVVIRVIGERK